MSMQATFTHPEAYSVNLPFEKITSRAIIMRRKDGAMLGMLHRVDGKYAPPGGHMADGEAPHETIMRELDEEKVRLINSDEHWRDRMIVDYFAKTGSLNIWYIFVVEDAQLGYSNEYVEVRWLNQDMDVWYPSMREKILFAVKQFTPDLLRIQVGVLGTW